MLNVYIANLAKYTEGTLKGKWFSLPAEEEEIDAVIAEVLGKDEEIAIHDYESELKIRVPEYANLYHLNHLMQKLEGFSVEDRKVICLIADYEGLSLEEVIDDYKDGKYMVFEASDYGELGYYLNENGLLGVQIPEELERHINYNSIGEEWLHNGNFIDLSEHNYYITY